MRKITLLITLFIVSITWQSNAQDSCASAIVLTPGTPQVGDTTGNSPGSFSDSNTAPEVNPCSSNYNDLEYWFKYTAVTTGDTLDITVSDLTSNYYGVFIIDNCPDSTPACIAQDTNGFSSVDLTVTSPSLTAGTTYYIVLSDWIEGSTTFTMNSTVIPAPTCPAPTTLTSANITETSADLSWAQGASEAAWEYVLLLDADPAPTTGTSTAMTTYGAAMLTAGTNYIFYVRADCTGGDYSDWISTAFTTLTPPPANDACGGAITVAVGIETCGADVIGTNAGATDSGVTQATCATATYNGGDIWYTFTMPAGETALNYTRGASAFSTTQVELYGDTCGALTELDCTTSVSYTFTGLTAGATYYLRLYDWSNDNFGDVTFCLGTPPPPPPNDDCSGAIALTPGTTFEANPIDGTVESATADAEPNSCGSNGPGVWYSLVVPADGNITIETGPDAVTSDTGFDSLVEAFSGTCGALTSIGCDDDGAATNFFSLLDLTGLTPGSTIYLRVWESGGGQFEPYSISAYNASLSVEDNIIEGFTIYPNPVNDILRFNAQDDIKSISIYNLLGQEVLRTQPRVSNTEVNMTNLPTGMYVVKVQVGEQLGSYRIIKE